MTFVYSSFKKLVGDWISQETNIPVIFTHPNAPRPKKTYASLQVLSIANIGQTSRISKATPGKFDLSQQVDISVTVNVYGDSAPEVLIDLVFSLGTQRVRDLFSGHGIAIRTHTAATYGSTLIGSEFEQRALFDVTFGGVVLREEDLSLIDSVELL